MKTIIFISLIIVNAFVANISKSDFPHPDHIVIVIMENHGYNQIIGSSNAPYINSLANDPKGALFTNSHGLTHPSQPNYLMLYSGSNQGVTNDNLPANLPFTTLNLGASLIDAGKSFITYSEDLPSVGYNGVSSGYYARKHNPCANWQASPANGYPITVNQPFTSYPSDYNSLPTVSFVVPNQLNDMHSGTVQQGDTWLQNNLDAYITWSKTHNSLLILTFDEDNNTSPNQIVTIFAGEKVLAGQYSDNINHYNILRTIEDIYSLPRAGASNTATPITNCWLPLTGIINNSVPLEFNLKQNYPNPFNPTTNLEFGISKFGFVSLKIYDILGKEVAALVNTNLNPGTYKYKFDASDLTSGIYFYSLNYSGENGEIFSDRKKLVLVK